MINPKDGEIMGYGNTEVFLTPEEDPQIQAAIKALN